MMNGGRKIGINLAGTNDHEGPIVGFPAFFFADPWLEIF